MRSLLIFICFALVLSHHSSNSQVIEDVRLVNGTYGDHMGRVELLINGTWGTICNDAWNYPDARTACRMLDLITVVCTVNGPTFGDPADVPVLMQAIYCGGRENDLNDCSYNLAGPNETCQTGAGVVCVKRVVGRPTNVTQLDATATSVTIGFQLPELPDGVTCMRFRLQLSGGDFYYCYADNDGTTWFQCTFPELSPGTTYRLLVRVDVVYSVCSRTGYLYGNFSDAIEASTTAPVPQPTDPPIPVRLVSPRADATFMGRLEVLYNNTWGTVCDDAFQSPEANVVCETLGYSGAVCYAREARLGRGNGPIWIDNLDCSRSHDTLSECDFNDWGVNNCDHSADVGVICWTDEYQAAVGHLSVLDTTGSSITVAWESFNFPPLTSAAGYQISYRSRSTSLVSTEHSETQYTITGLQTNITYSIRVRARFHFSQYCVTTTFRNADWSTTVTATTIETAPSAPPSLFHVVVISSTAIEFQWERPPLEFQNGIIRGYKLFYREEGSMSERMVDVQDPDPTVEIVAGLSPGTVYVCSMLAYTGADGPRTLYLTVSTYANDYTPFIIYFGINGDGLDRAVRNLHSEGDIAIQCGTGTTNVTINWYFSNGSQIGSTDRNVRQARDPEGKAILQLANGQPVDYCDAGVYTCRAVSTSGVIQERMFTLRVNDAPPTPGIAYTQSVGSTWITITWTDLICDGGHMVIWRNIRYGKDFQNFILPTNMYIYNINASLREYTIQNLEPSTSYNISIQAVSADFRASDFSAGNIISTLPPAPSAPRSVRARLVSPRQSVVEVRWREPAVPNGIISQYTVLVSERSVTVGNGGELLVNRPDTFNITYPGHIGAANVTLRNSEIYYTFQVRASNLVNGFQNHGDFSEVTMESTVFVPRRGLPVPRNVQVIRSTNSTASLIWDYPMAPHDPIIRFQVAYFANIEWYSPEGTLVKFEERGVVSSYNNNVMVSQLTPGTVYTFRVSAVVENGERGAEILVSGTTTEATGEKLAYFELRILQIGSCNFWQEHSIERIPLIKDSLLNQLKSSICPTCRLTNRTITNEELSCRHGLVNQVVFRGRIIGNSRYSAKGLVGLVQSWIESGSASIVINSVRYHLDPSCSTSLDSPSASDCVATSASSAPSQEPTTSSLSAQNLNLQGTISGGQIGGLIVGLLIAVLLLLFVVLLAILIYRSFRGTKGTKPLQTNESLVIFSDVKDADDDIKPDSVGNGGSEY